MLIFALVQRDQYVYEDRLENNTCFQVTMCFNVQCVHKVSLQFQEFLTKANEKTDK